MVTVTVRRPLHEDGRTYQVGEAFTTTEARAARLEQLGLVRQVQAAVEEPADLAPQPATVEPAFVPANVDIQPATGGLTMESSPVVPPAHGAPITPPGRGGRKR